LALQVDSDSWLSTREI